MIAVLTDGKAVYAETRIAKEELPALNARASAPLRWVDKNETCGEPEAIRLLRRVSAGACGEEEADRLAEMLKVSHAWRRAPRSPVNEKTAA